VALARALACARGLLILDEPTSRLDEQAAGRIAGLLVTASRERAQTIICASHDEQLIDRGDSVISLSG
jgi:ABC-type lipoprotein export system ATPase subunit